MSSFAPKVHNKHLIIVGHIEFSSKICIPSERESLK